MSNVIRFPTRPPKQTSTATPTVPTGTSLAHPDEVLEYHLSAIMLAASWAYQTGRVPLGDRFIRICRLAAYAHWIELPPDLYPVMDRVDYALAMHGDQSSE